MSRPSEPDHVKLISSLFSSDGGLIDLTINELSKIFGPADLISNRLLFDRTKYYAREMGWPLYRRFISFTELVPADRLAEIKLKTNAVEQQYLSDGNRLVNIDPGFISPERLVLGTGKNYIHRVYLIKGIYADLTLVFQRKSFKPLEWTYPDYADQSAIDFFNGVRDLYMKQLKEMRRIDQEYDSLRQE